MVAIPLLAVGFIMTVVAVLFVFCAVALILVVLIQKGRGGGLSGVLGGAMAGGILGSKTGDFLTWVTIGLVSVFLMLAVVMARYYKPAVKEFVEPTPPPIKQPTGTEQPLGEVPAATGEAGESSDTNVPGG